jgi:sugar lactone lactonase YvrE
MSRFELAWDAKCQLGESPVWDARRGRVLFADIHARRIHRYAPSAGPRGHWELPDIVPSFGLCRSSRIVAAQRHSVVLFDPRTDQVQTLAELPEEPETTRLNDGKVGPDGCFWVGSMDTRAAKEPIGSLYRVRPDGRVERKVEGFKIFNGLAWSPDGSVMFHACTPSAVIEAWDFDRATGRLSNRRRIATLSPEEGRPDGGAFDEQGCYWSAGVSAGRLNRFSRTGELLAWFSFPVPAPSMPCFVGRDLYVTSLYEHRETLREQFPALGGLFRMRADVAGAAIAEFADT